MNISEFVQGDEIVRVEPSKPYSSGLRDRSYMDEKLCFIGIENGQILFKRTDKIYLTVFGDDICCVPLNKWDEGWKSFIIINFKFGR